MSLLFALVVAIVIAAVVQYLFPGAPLYQYGWFNVALVALTIIVFARASALRSRLAPWALLSIAFGAGIIAAVTVANGLLAPAPRTIVGAPGQRIPVDDLQGALNFPLDATVMQTVALERPERLTVTIPPSGWRYVHALLVLQVQRDVVQVGAGDSRDESLTITQPTGAAFLSPVLLMQQRQNIAGLSLPFDSFAVPAAHRIVKAVLFTSQEAAALGRLTGTGGAVLFAVDDDADQPLPHAIRIAHSGERISVGGLILRPQILRYPAIEIIAVPALPWLAVGLALILVGALGTIVASMTARKGGDQHAD
jgi:hypothetical protein